MAIEATCGNCGKKYRVDAQFAGKKAKCKACGQAFLIPALSAAANADDDLLAGLTAAAGAEQRVTTPLAPAAKPARGRSTPPPSPPAPDDGYDLDSPPSPNAPAATVCPSCGVPMAPSAVLCVSCGYHRKTGSAIRTEVQAHAQPTSGVPRQMFGAAAPPRTTLAGIRENTPYQNSILNFIDTVVPKVASGLVIALGVAPIVLLLFVAGHMPQAQVLKSTSVGCLAILIGLGLLFYVTLPIIVWGVRIAGKIMKFDLPEFPEKRVLAVLLCAGLVNFVLIGIMFFSRPAVAPLARGHSVVQVGTMLLPILLQIIASAGTIFCMFWFFFRLRILEALLGFVFFFVFYFVAAVVTGIVVYLLLALTGVLVTGAGMQ